MATNRSQRSEAPGRYSGVQEWSLTDCLRILRRRRLTLLWITCLGLLVTTAITLAQSHIYRSRALQTICMTRLVCTWLTRMSW